jgi:hypothetical protein
MVAHLPRTNTWLNISVNTPATTWATTCASRKKGGKMEVLFRPAERHSASLQARLLQVTDS